MSYELAIQIFWDIFDQRNRHVDHRSSSKRGEGSQDLHRSRDSSADIMSYGSRTY